ncbi:MAG: type II toxin-antitoxin system RelE/ParE family toxin [Candidatus Bathyarchaeia archaeon]
MPYQIKLHREVARALSRMPPGLRSTIIDKLRALEEDPYTTRPGADIIRLRGTKGREDLFRLRIGDYRAIYAVHEDCVYVTDLFHRGRGYI